MIGIRGNIEDVIFEGTYYKVFTHHLVKTTTTTTKPFTHHLVKVA